MTAVTVVTTGTHLCPCGAVVHADKWAGLKVGRTVRCHRCTPAVWWQP